MTPEFIVSAGGGLATIVLAVLAWSINRNVSNVDGKVSRIETDVRQLSAQGARHGEALAGGVAKFAAMEKRLDKVEAKQDQFTKDCVACQVERARQ